MIELVNEFRQACLGLNNNIKKVYGKIARDHDEMKDNSLEILAKLGEIEEKIVEIKYDTTFLYNTQRTVMEELKNAQPNIKDTKRKSKKTKV